MSTFLKNTSVLILLCLLFTASISCAVEFGEGSADFTHPYLSAWHPGFSAKLYGTNPETSVTGWRKYSVEGSVLVGGINCVPVKFTDSAGADYNIYLAQDTSGNIRYLKEGSLSFLPDPPIFIPASTSNGTTWDIQYLMGQHRFSIDYHDTYPENAWGFGPYSSSLYIRHYWDGALLGLIVVAPRFGFAHYDGQDISERQLSNLGTIEGIVRDAWNQTPLSNVTVWFDHTPPRKTTTDSNGFYRFIDLPQRYYQLECLKNLYVDYSVSVQMPLGENVVFDVNMIPLSGVIKGKVTDAWSGLPVHNATIQLDGDENQRFYTDAAGLYRVENVRVGSHYAHAWGGSHNLDGKPVDVAADQEVEVNFSLEPVFGAIEGRLLDSLSLEPVTSGVAQLDSMNDTQIITGGDGVFRLDDVAPGIHYLQAWASGYLYYQKRITLDINETLDMGDVLLVPESYMLPITTKFTFDEGPDSWKFISVPEFFSVPDTTQENGHLGFSPAGSTNSYGYWESPFIAFTPGKTYRIRCTLMSDQYNPEDVPTVRIRVNSGNNQTVGLLVINSTTDGDSSPTIDPKVYDLVFTPPVSASSSGFSIAFDLVNIGTTDNASAWIYLEEVEIEEVGISPVSP
ncbi:carboxypeptidase regulatory-like domain-containing protein [Candidatus Sumerlaeota bacterium]|nr:carboxypeptidase regulatory-like domain-containing protein [Candidatus Sumerlaeota bacterium]